jgi:E1A/CREB-binding protein
MMELTQLPQASQGFGSQTNQEMDLMDGNDNKASSAHFDQEKLYPSHELESNAERQVEFCEKLCQASSADTGQSEVASNDEAPNQIKEIGNMLPSQQVKLQRWLLIFLRHVSKCTDSSRCNVARCAVGHQKWKHLISCQDYACLYPKCMYLKSLLSHHQKCRSVKCTICGPVRAYFSHQAATMASKMQKGPREPNEGSANDVSLHEIDSPPVMKRMKVEAVKLDSDPTHEQPELVGTIGQCHDQHDGCDSYVTAVTPKSAEDEIKMSRTIVTSVDPEGVPMNSQLPHQSVESPIESSISQRSLVNIKPLPVNDTKIESNPVRKDFTVCLTNSRITQPAEKPSNQTSIVTTLVPPKGSSETGKPVKAKVSGISYIENFTPEQIRQHIATLRKWIGQVISLLIYSPSCFP